jgi:hypothetical protein
MDADHNISVIVSFVVSRIFVMRDAAWVHARWDERASGVLGALSEHVPHMSWVVRAHLFTNRVADIMSSG